jgi:hypothetical protein
MIVTTTTLGRMVAVKGAVRVGTGLKNSVGVAASDGNGEGISVAGSTWGMNVCEGGGGGVDTGEDGRLQAVMRIRNAREKEIKRE